MKSGRVCFRTRLGRGNLAVATLILGKSASASFVSEDRRVCIGGVIFTFLPYFVPVGCFLKASTDGSFLKYYISRGNVATTRVDPRAGRAKSQLTFLGTPHTTSKGVGASPRNPLTCLT